MNYDFLLHDRLLPSYFKVVSILSISIIIVLALYLKFTHLTHISEITPGMLKWFLYLSLCMHLISKDKIEDERNREIYLQVYRVGFRLFLGFMMIYLGANLLSENFQDRTSFYFVISILGYLVIFSELAKNSRLIDFIEKSRFIYLSSMILIMIGILFFNKWLWGWPTV